MAEPSIADAVPIGSRMSGRFGRAGNVLTGAAVLAALLALWQVAGVNKWVDDGLLPPFTDVAAQFWLRWTEPSLLESTFFRESLTTLRHLLVGFGITLLLGVALGIVIGYWNSIGDRVGLTLDLLRYMPAAAAVPAFLLFMGPGDMTVIAVVIFGGIWPVLLNTMDAVRGSDRILLEVGQIYRLRRLQQIRKILLPAIMPQVFAGARVALSIGILLAIVGEYLGGGSGVGNVILLAQRQFQMKELYAGILLLGLMGIALNGLFVLVERQVLRWYIGKLAVHS
jgi:ABC-type nitrate/sulfonate/bicarbonate transport system permease component